MHAVAQRPKAIVSVLIFSTSENDFDRLEESIHKLECHHPNKAQSHNVKLYPTHERKRRNLKQYSYES